MNRRQALLTAGAALAGLPALAATGGRWTRLKWVSGRIFVDGTINKRPMSIMLDSGSAPTLVDIDHTRDLGLSFSDQTTVTGNAGGAAEVLKAGDFTLSLAGMAVRFPAEGALAADLEPLAPGWGVGAVAGQALFEANRLDLDLPRSRLRVAEDLPAGWASLPLSQEADGLRCVPLTIGQTSLAATFDLGSAIPLQVTRDWATAHGILEGLRQSSWVSSGIDGAAVIATAILPQVELAGFTLRNVPIAVVDSQPSGASPAVIGTPVWLRFRLLTDYVAGRLGLQPDSNSLKSPFNRDRSGLAVQFEGSALTVIHVAKASPAEATGWTVGEHIVAVDGHVLDIDWPGSRRSGWARQKAGTRVRLTLADGSQRELVLADYY